VTVLHKRVSIAPFGLWISKNRSVAEILSVDLDRFILDTADFRNGARIAVDAARGGCVGEDYPSGGLVRFA